MNYIEKAYKIFFFLFVFFLTSTISNAGYSIAMGGVAVCLLISFSKRHDEFQLYNVLPDKNYLMVYGVFFCSLLLASFFALNQTATSITLKYLYWTLPFWLVYFSTLFLPFAQRIWCNAISLAMIVAGGFTIHQFWSAPFGTRLAGPMVNPNSLAGILELCIPYIVWYTIYGRNNCCKKEFYLNLIATLVALFSLLFTQSRGGIAGVIIGLITLVTIKIYFKYQGKISFKKKMALVMIGVIFIGGTILSGFIFFHRSYDNERLLLIESSYHMWEDNKVFGVGLDNWKAEYKKYVSPLAKEPDLPMPHNNIAFFFSTTGVVGGLGYFVYVLGTLYILLKKMKNCHANIYYAATFWAFLAIVIHGMVDMGLDNKFHMQILSAGLGIALSCVGNKKYLN